VTQISFWKPAGTYTVPGKGEFPQKFAAHVFDAQIGKQVPVKGPGREDLGLCTLVAAEVAEDGTGVTLTIEAPEGFGPAGFAAAGGMGFTFADPDPGPAPRDPLSASPPRITRKMP
jgi:hypothetical protein